MSNDNLPKGGGLLGASVRQMIVDIRKHKEQEAAREVEEMQMKYAEACTEHV